MVESASRVIYLEAMINSSKLGNLTNNITVTGVPPSGDNVTANDSEDVRVNTTSVSVNKTADPTSGSNGTVVNFTINVTNTGNATLNPVIVTDTLPEGLDYVSSTGILNTSNNNVTWNIGKLNESEPKVVYLEARINRSESGVLINSAAAIGVPQMAVNVSAIDYADIFVDDNKTVLVLSLDTSGSMKKYYRLAPNESTEIVSGWSGFDNATVSIVSWDHESELVFGPAPLAGNETSIAEVLENLSARCIETDLTYYDQGLNGSLAVLRESAALAPNSSRIIIFLTGFSEFEPGEKLDDYISEANESGCKIFTIGIGINETFNASEKQLHYLTKISTGTGGEFYNVTAFSPGELNPVIKKIASEVDGQS
jgi:uncharacterized repeat protein (TIGR01451 family)